MLVKLSSSVYYYKAKIDPDDAPIQDELTRLAEEQRSWGKNSAAGAFGKCIITCVDVPCLGIINGCTGFIYR